MPNNGAWVNVNPGNSLIYIPAGYHSGGGYVDARQSYNTGYNSGYTSGYNNGVSSGSGGSSTGTVKRPIWLYAGPDKVSFGLDRKMEFTLVGATQTAYVWIEGHYKGPIAVNQMYDMEYLLNKYDVEPDSNGALTVAFSDMAWVVLWVEIDYTYDVPKIMTVKQEVHIGTGGFAEVTTNLSGISKIYGYGAIGSSGNTGTNAATNQCISIAQSSCTTTQLWVKYNNQKSQGSSTEYEWQIIYS